MWRRLLAAGALQWRQRAGGEVNERVTSSSALKVLLFASRRPRPRPRRQRRPSTARKKKNFFFAGEISAAPRKNRIILPICEVMKAYKRCDDFLCGKDESSTEKPDESPAVKKKKSVFAYPADRSRVPQPTIARGAAFLGGGHRPTGHPPPAPAYFLQDRP